MIAKLAKNRIPKARRIMKETLKVWQEVAKTNGHKPDWAIAKYDSGCPFCSEANKTKRGCTTCPLNIEFGGMSCSPAYGKWAEARGGGGKRIKAAKAVVKEFQALDQAWAKKEKE